MNSLRLSQLLTALPAGVARLRWWQAALLLTGLFLAATWPLLTGQAYEKWDAYGLGVPYYSLLADFARAGHLLYWNPWVAGGSPDFAAGGGTFSPDLLLCAVLTGPGPMGYTIYWLSAWLAGGMGMLFLARHLQVPPWGALVVALGYIFSGYYTGHAEHVGVVYSHSLLPFVIWRLDVALTQRRLIAAIQAGAFWGLTGLAGYPSLTLGIAGFIAMWWLGRTLLRNKGETVSSFQHGFLIVVLVAATGLIVLSPSYFSANYEARGYSDRSEPLERSFALSSNALHPGALASLSSPSVVAAKLAQPERWSYTDVSGLSLYTGSATLLLAALALVARKDRRWRCFLLACGLFALACAMSQALPLRGWIYDLLPPTRFFRHASMLRGFFLFCLSLLALLGARDLAEEQRNGKVAGRFLLLATILATFSCLTFCVLVLGTTGSFPELPGAIGHGVIAWGGLFLIALALRFRGTWIRFLPAALLILAATDALVSFHLSSGTIFDRGTRPALAAKPNSSVELGPEQFARGLGNSATNLNLFSKTPVFKNYAPLKNRFYELTATYPALGIVALGEDRVWFAPDAPEIGLSRQGFDAFKARCLQAEGPIFVRHKPEAMIDEYNPSDEDLRRIAAAPRPRHLPVSVTSYKPMQLIFDALAPSDGWLMVTERWSRSWHATVNGLEQPVAGANFIFRALPVQKGHNHIVFTYAPVAVPALLYCSWGALAAVLLLSLPFPVILRHAFRLPGSANQSGRWQFASS